MPSKIEWLNDGGAKGETINPWVGCSHVSEGCRNCYAERMAARQMTPAHKAVSCRGRWNGKVRGVDGVLDKPLRWKKPRRIFVCSMSDPFYEKVPDEWIDRLFAVMALTPQHQYVLLTKRGERMFRYITPLQNLILGVSVCNQADADKQIPWLMKCPARWRIVSYEPAIGSVNLNPWLTGIPRLDLLISGGESGPGARPSHPAWFRTARDQCAAAGVGFNFKQWGEWAHSSQIAELQGGQLIASESSGHVHNWPDGSLSIRVGKRAAGRLLDGATRDAWVEP